MSGRSKLEVDAALHSAAAVASRDSETLPALLNAKGQAALGSPCASTPRRLFDS